MRDTMLDDAKDDAEKREELEKEYAERIAEIDRDLLAERLTIISQFGDAVSGFAQASLNLQNTNLQERLSAHEAACQTELENESLTAEQKTEVEKRHKKEREAMIDAANKKARLAAVAERAVASAQAVIQTYRSAQETAANYVWPYNIIPMAAAIAQGLANVAVINSTPIPKLSAETGGRFVVPDVSPRRVDGVGMMVNPGETIDVTPRGESEYQVMTLNLVVDGSVLAQIVNHRARAGEIYNLQLARNL
jgi:hypothetical protein